MSDPSGVPAPDAGAERLPEVEEVRERDAALQREVEQGGGQNPSQDLVEQARQLLEDAKTLGSITWQFHERDELDAIARRAARIIRRSGARVEAVRIHPFKNEALPTFDSIVIDDFVAELKNGPVVGRRLENVDLRSVSELERGAPIEILDCAFIDCDFRDLDLRDARILHSVFDGCDFTGADLRGASLTSSLIKGRSDDEDERGGIGFENVRADGANFSASRLDHLTLESATFAGAIFSYAFLSHIQMSSETSFERGIFDLATIENVDATEANCSGALFIGCNLLRVDFTRTNLEGAVFSSSRVGGTSFRGARLANASLLRAYFVGRAAFDEETDLQGTELDPRDENEIRKGLNHGAEADIGDKPDYGSE